TASGLQMLVNGAPSGIYSVEQNAYINFVIPWSAPTNGTAEFLLFNPTTKEIVAAGTVGMALTGQGPVKNPPADGFPPSALTPTNLADLKVIINAKDIGPANIISSDLDPTYPGSWTVNVRIPTVAEGGPPPG